MKDDQRDHHHDAKRALASCSRRAIWTHLFFFLNMKQQEINLLWDKNGREENKTKNNF